MVKWTKEDIELLRKLYPDKTIDKKEIVKQLNKNWNAIRWYARNIVGLELRTDVNYWTPEDEKRLIELSQNPELRSHDIGKLLNRSPGAIRAKINGMLIERPKREKKNLELDNVDDHIYE